MDFTPLEKAALISILNETPQYADGLRHQLDIAVVTVRENTGGGFLTTIKVEASAEKVECPRVLGYQTHARVAGLEYGLGFVLFIDGGWLQMLEGYACGGEDTTSLPLSALTFEIYKTPL
jgi:hypothetical protein